MGRTLKSLAPRGDACEVFPKSARNRFLSLNEVGRPLDACHTHFRPIVLTAIGTGMRNSEILGLKWSEIRNVLVYLPGERTKNGKLRKIPISGRLSTELQRIRREQLRGDVVAASDLMFRTVRGNPKKDGMGRLKVLPTRIKVSGWGGKRRRRGRASTPTSASTT